METDDDNFPKKNFFSKINLKYTVREVLNKSWVNVYLNFLITIKKMKIIIFCKKKIRFFFYFFWITSLFFLTYKI